MPALKSCSAFVYSFIPSFMHINEGMMPFWNIVTKLQFTQTSSLMQCLVLLCGLTGVMSSFPLPFYTPKPINSVRGSVVVRSRSTCFSMFSAPGVHLLLSIASPPHPPPCIPCSSKRNLKFYLENQFSSTLGLHHLGRDDPILGLQP